ncbi:MAG TPA: DUF6326 family protein [Ornithinimicrobium sp.]|uniref:DUF6326 family protein n=1 Tax=Ornithinimicrobium sp. TaxID=1977084 RepID=UPI002B47C583|nr:DUF6326 family protein [Ornithinimicrobium sp.]HKJ11193.1 DUF6326 family protein [Ornithinimicrobium sp.]
MSTEPLDRRIVLSGLWTSMLFVFAYVDIFGFFRADVLEGALAGVISGPGFAIDQTFLAATTLYILVPSLMVVGCLLLPYRVSRRANLVLAVLYMGTIVASMVGETWAYYLVGSAVEVGLLAAVAAVAVRWR